MMAAPNPRPNAKITLMRPSKKSKLPSSIPFPVFVFFLIFLVSNTLLSYASLSLTGKCWVCFLGVLAPLGLAVYWVVKDRLKGSTPPFSGPWSGAVPPGWLWALFIAALVFTRLYHCMTLPFWPLGDEGIFFSFGRSQLEHWNWKLLWGEVRFEPLMVWLLGFYFHGVTPSLASIRALTIAVSLLTSAAVYGAARYYLPKSTAFLFCVLLSFCFWDLTLSRLCLLVILIPLFHAFGFWALGAFLRANKREDQWKILLALGVLAGVGFYTWTNWPFVWLSLAGLLGGFALSTKRSWPFLGGFIAIALPFVGSLAWARLQPGGTAHINHLWSTSCFSSLFSNFYSLFWDGSSGFPYGSNWGGVLNPLLGSLILVGLLHLIQTGTRVRLAAVGFLLFCYSLPAALTSGFEMYRFLPLLGLLLLAAVWGLERLGSHFSRRGFMAWAVFVTLISSAWDAYGYLAHFNNIGKVPIAQQWRSLTYAQAYDILKPISQKTGPLYVFLEFSTDYDNKTLNLATYPFNALENPSLGASVPQWASVITNHYYAPYFQSHFPGTQIFPLEAAQIPTQTSILALFLIPASSFSPSTLERWKEEDRFLRELGFQITDRNPLLEWSSYSDTLTSYSNHFQQDPFLTSVFWEKCAFFELLSDNLPQAALYYKNAIRLGIPSAHLCYDLSLTLDRLGKTQEAHQYLLQSKQLARPLLGLGNGSWLKKTDPPLGNHSSKKIPNV